MEAPLYAAYPDLKGKRVITTAATDGIGKEVARAFALQGCSVAVLSRNADKVERVAAELAAESGSAVHGVQCNLTDEQQTKDAVGKAATLLGGVDVLFLNPPGHTAASHEAMGRGDTVASIMEQMRANVVPCVAAFDAALEHLSASAEVAAGDGNSSDRSRHRGASVITISSVATMGVHAEMALFGYSQAKAALEQWTRAVAFIHAGKGIRANAIVPGVIDTTAWQPLADNFGVERSKVLSKYPPTIPLRRCGTPRDIAAAALFLASNVSSGYMTGSSIVVDGGWSMTHPVNEHLLPGKDDEVWDWSAAGSSS